MSAKLGNHWEYRKMNRRRIVVIVAVTIGYVFYQLTSPILLPFLGILISLNALFNHDLVWELQTRGSHRFGYPLGERTAQWERIITILGCALFAVIVLIFALPYL